MSATCSTARRSSTEPCSITAEVKNRNGKPRWWCSTHGARAWGTDGEPLPVCAGALAEDPQDAPRVLRLRPSEYSGGVGVWGAIPPVFNTGPDADDCGIHVHARNEPGGHKVIDETFREVVLELASGDVEVDAAAATAYVAAAVFGLELKALQCPHCGHDHLDADEFGAAAHRKHQCNSCGRHFFDPQGIPSISNPLARLATQSPLRQVVMSTQTLSISQRQFPGGISIWGSNPAFLWTSERPEEAGLHVHAWSASGKLVIDDTFGAVTVDGLAVDATMTRVLMVQRSMRYLRHRIVCLRCPRCGEPHFDAGADSMKPRPSHDCSTCGLNFLGRSRHRLLVSNPMVEVFDRLMSTRHN